jgi:predicted ATPase
MHLLRAVLHPERFPGVDSYPFNLEIFRRAPPIVFRAPVTFFIGENGSGKSTLLKALVRKCGIHIWADTESRRSGYNRWEEDLHTYLDITWADGPVPGSLFSSDIFRYFAECIDDWAAADPGTLKYFGGRSLLTQSHGQSIMSYFQSRYGIRGIYFLDEPETALSPARQIELVKLLAAVSGDGHAQFVIATHSPIVMSCPGAVILGFDGQGIREVSYRETEHYRVYRDFMADPEGHLKG